jgi:hypothetical protein
MRAINVIGGKVWLAARSQKLAALSLPFANSARAAVT